MPIAPAAAEPVCGPTVAIVDVDGVILNTPAVGPLSYGDNAVALFREKLDAIANDANVAAVVLRINSPGGSVTATDVMWHDLQQFRQRTRKPVVACLMDVAAGGGYYLATASDEIIAHPTTVTGGVGVILNLFNLREMMGQFNILPQEVKSGQRIDIGSPVRALSDEDKAILEKMASEFHLRFIDVVKAARPQVAELGGTTFDGRVFTAREAAERKLIDRIGYLDDAIAAAGQLGGCPQAKPVFYHRASDPARSIYAVTPNSPLHTNLFPLRIPGLDRSSLPTFLYLWQPEPSLERAAGR